MRVTVISAIAILSFSFATAQKTDRKEIKYEFEMYPLETISKLKEVDVNASLDYQEKSKAALLVVEEKKAKAKEDREEYEKKSVGEKFAEKAFLGQRKPSGQYETNEFIPSLFESSILESAVNINGFTKREGSTCIVNVVFSEFKYTIGVDNKSVIYYPNKINLTVINDKGASVFSGDLPNNNTVSTYTGAVNLTTIKSLELQAKDKAVSNLNSYLNSNYGFNLVKGETPFFDVKDKKFNYPDYHEAIQKVETAFISVNIPERQEKFIKLLTECVNVWETNLKELDKSNKDAKINKYVAAATTLNLAVAYSWLKDFNKSYDNLEEHKALDEDYSNTYKFVMKFVKDYSERYNKYNKY